MCFETRIFMKVFFLNIFSISKTISPEYSQGNRRKQKYGKKFGK